MVPQIVAFLLALALSWVLTPWIRRVAIRLNVMVHPGGRRVHVRPMPLWGGAAIYMAFLVASLVTIGLLHWRFKLDMPVPVIGTLVASAIIVVAGMLDDMKEWPAKTQIAVIVVAALVLAAFEVRIVNVTDPFHSNKLIMLSPLWSWALTLVWVFAVTKTVDFMDGLDGLAAGIGAIAAGVLAIMAVYKAHSQAPASIPVIAIALCGACIGFLRFNFNPAKIFMGTGGSQFIGFMLAAISILGAFKGAAAMAIALPVLVLGVPLFDGIFVAIRRLLNGQPLHIADKTHLHHRLMDRGFSQKQAVLLVWGISLFLGVTALVIYIRIR